MKSCFCSLKILVVVLFVVVHGVGISFAQETSSTVSDSKVGETETKVEKNPEAVATAEAAERVGRIRAALVYYIAKFVDFKNRNVENGIVVDKNGEQDPTELCIFGDDHMNPYIKSTLVGKVVNGRGLKVSLKSKSSQKSDLEGCKIVYFNQETTHLFDELIRSANEKGMLTICMVPSLSWGSCLIQLYEENNKAKIAIDLKNKSSDNFVLSSELLEVSTVNK